MLFIGFFCGIFTCWPISMCGYIQSEATRRAIDRGDMTEAWQASARARNFLIAAVTVGILTVAAVVLVIVLIFTGNL